MRSIRSLRFLHRLEEAALRPRIRSFLVASSLLLGAVLFQASPAGATFPGDNGLIAFDDYDVIEGDYSEHVFTVNPDGSGLTDLTPNIINNAFTPSWSPDGQRIVFVRDYPQGIYVMGADGSRMRVLIYGQYGSPVFSPDGRFIAYSSSNNPTGIHGMRIRDGKTRRITDSTHDSDPDWSPDGQRIVYVHSNEIWVVDVNTLTRTRLTTGHSDNHPSWSPDGTKIAFDRYEGTTNVWTMNADGSGLVNITAGLGDGFDMPAWSPDGSWIVVRRWNDCYGGGLALVDPAGTTLVGVVCFYDAQNAAWQSI